MAMAALRWIAGLLIAASLASCYCSRAQSPDTTGTTTCGDIAARFVSALIANATQAEQQQQHASKGRSLVCAKIQNNPLVADLGYAKYRGYHNATTGLNYWKGIRYAFPPTGKLRWQPPRPLAPSPGAAVTDATAFGPICPQLLPAVPGATFTPGNEDCLYLNVYAPPNATRLPVLVWIHGGGYGLGDGTEDMTDIINANEKGFVAVTIQYRLGAFGWLSSGEVNTKGAVNAGMLDQAMALAWVRLHIAKFGGDPSAVTISCESAGGGSVMYHAIAFNGSLGTLLFNQGIAASPYLPFQYQFDDPLPTSRYYAFSQAAGCPSNGSVFDCLVAKDTTTLQQASFNVTQQAAAYGYWGFWPVTDNSYIMTLPTQQLTAKKVNGNKLLAGHNANEGPRFLPSTITTQADLVAWLHGSEFPNLSASQIDAILAANPNTAPTDPSGPRFDTDGLGNATTAVSVSQAANGQQQRANNIYAEATFVCPAYWLASAYSGGSRQATSSWLYQYSVPFAYHGADVPGYFGPATPNLSDDFARAFRRMWGNFVTKGDPSIADELANGAGAANPGAPNPASRWPAWTDGALQFLNLNTTGGVPVRAKTPWGTTVTEFAQPGLRNAISLQSAARWEGGRKARCDVYLSLGPSIPA